MLSALIALALLVASAELADHPRAVAASPAIQTSETRTDDDALLPLLEEAIPSPHVIPAAMDANGSLVALHAMGGPDAYDDGVRRASVSFHPGETAMSLAPYRGGVSPRGSDKSERPLMQAAQQMFSPETAELVRGAAEMGTAAVDMIADTTAALVDELRWMSDNDGRLFGTVYDETDVASQARSPPL